VREKRAYLTYLGDGELGDCLTARGSLLRVEGVVAGGVVAGGVVAGGVVAGGVVAGGVTGGAVTGRVTGADGRDGLRGVGVVGVAGAAGGRSLARPPGVPPGRYGVPAAGGVGPTDG
jgi:hypothetical protein